MAESQTPTPERTVRRPRGKTRDQVPAADGARATSLASVAGVPDEVTLGGRTFHLTALTFNDLVTAERTFGDVGALLEGVAAQRPSAIRAFAWLMLRKCEPDLTEEQVGELLPITQAESLLILMVLLNASGAFAAATEASAGGPPAPSTGS